MVEVVDNNKKIEILEKYDIWYRIQEYPRVVNYLLIHSEQELRDMFANYDLKK